MVDLLVAFGRFFGLGSLLDYMGIILVTALVFEEISIISVILYLFFSL